MIKDHERSEKLESLYANKKKAASTLVLLAVLLIVCFLLSFNFGRYEGIGIIDVTKALLGTLPFVDPGVPSDVSTVVLHIRLPRILSAVLVGAMLSLAGASYQSVFRNPLVSPDILGASAGASMGAAIAIFSGLNGVYVQLFAFICGLAAIAVTYLVATKVKRDQILALILSGMVVAALANAIVSLLKFSADPLDKLPAITYWLMGSLSAVSLADILWVLVPMLAGTIALLLLKWKLNVLSLGDDEAKMLGVETKKTRLVVIVSATLITAAAISIAGLVGWVGLIIPHFCRMFVGSDNRYLIPASLFTGGIFLLLVDNVARSLLTQEIPIGILTAIIGAPFFIAMITKKRGE